ncbi:hypothetical protein LX64_00688 [Chitinophaga skermanii]|uniref:Uncharacterized protein n=1 Tax=Chitinophaga skermanii TaxID=331697 RepID=A0A327R2Z7_9BACT|nr:hypothetical protein [Chitinophaga skermanii]RAJ11080.1 hypothetical protein LX64_00688 [Chitinophaga skermanii]
MTPKYEIEAKELRRKQALAAVSELKKETRHYRIHEYYSCNFLQIKEKLVSTAGGTTIVAADVLSELGYPFQKDTQLLLVLINNSIKEGLLSASNFQ